MHSSYFINLWVTDRCNFKCRYCYVKPNQTKLDLYIDTVDDIVCFIESTIKKEQPLIVNFHGGEPLLNLDVIKYFMTKCNRIFSDVSYGITTNGYLLDDEEIHFLASNFSYNLSVSIDGKKTTHDMNRVSLDGNDTHATVMNNAKKLLSENPNVRIRMTYDRNNISSLYENIKYFSDEGFNIIVPVADYYSTDWTNEDFKLIKDAFISVKTYSLKKNNKNVKLRILDENFHSLNCCTAGHDYFSIDVNGNIYPCIALVGDDQQIIGNVKNGIDKGKLKELDQKKCQKVYACEACVLYEFCESTRCLLVNYATTGDYLKPNLVTCNMMKVHLDVINEKIER